MDKYQVVEVQEVVSMRYWVYEVEAESQKEAIDMVRYNNDGSVYSVVASSVVKTVDEGEVGDPQYNDWQGFGVDIDSAVEDANA